ncbi:DUF2384 domain-containing protein [Deinococcus hohokamensis]|uniref:DUF2384 domain-containing protein n=1 Tax=Deinococcus hohokamensis TaxID=309883 RepID=A0ABV9I7P8_9DEIO
MNRSTSPISDHAIVLVSRALTNLGLTLSHQAQVLGLSPRVLQLALGGTVSVQLSSAQAQRLRLVSEIVLALGILYSEDSAVGWLGRPNGRQPFDGQTPLHFILGGGLPALVATHRLLAGDLSGQFSATPEARALAGRLPQPEIELDE